MKTFETPINQIESIYSYFHNPAHSAEIQMASDKTQYVWQHMSNYYPTEQILRNGPIHELREHLDPAIGKISVDFRDGTAKTVDEYFETSTMDAMLVLHEGNVVFERMSGTRQCAPTTSTSGSRAARSLPAPWWSCWCMRERWMLKVRYLTMCRSSKAQVDGKLKLPEEPQ